MLRLSRAMVIQQLELLVNDSIRQIGRNEWSVRGVDCKRERDNYSTLLQF